MNELRRLSVEGNQPNVLTQKRGNNAVIILNRPKSLNSLTLSLCKELYKTLKDLENETALVILKGAGDRAFCAGGDLFKMESAGRRGDLNHLSNIITYLNLIIYLIHQYKIPTIALMNGIAFGGGAGLPIFSKYRISTEQTRFSMPEVKLGYHPNSAATYFFNRSRGKLGYYLALTGDALTAADVVHAGFATHYCHTSKLDQLERDLLASNGKNIDEILERYCDKILPKFSLEPVMERINKCFSQSTIEGIVLKLKQDGSIWAEKTLNKINRCSPTSLKVILRQLQIGKNMNLEECLLMESFLSVNFFNYPDVFEGTRIIMKDRNDSPKWCPSSLSQVTEENIERYFEPYGERRHKELLFEIKNSRE